MTATTALDQLISAICSNSINEHDDPPPQMSSDFFVDTTNQLGPADRGNHCGRLLTPIPDFNMVDKLPYDWTGPLSPNAFPNAHAVPTRGCDLLTRSSISTVRGVRPSAGHRPMQFNAIIDEADELDESTPMDVDDPV